MDFDSIQKAGSRLGTGTMIVLDDKTCPVGMLRNLEHFFAQESCGWCTPCWSRAVLGGTDPGSDLEEGHGQPSRSGTAAISRAPAGPGHTPFARWRPAPWNRLQSGLKYFRDDFERHIREKRCPWR